jgi:nitroreductase
MNMQELVRLTRSYRRFHETHEISRETLEQLVDLARLGASGRNLQPLKYAVCNDRERNAQLFPEMAWAGYLKEWPGPVAGERPSAYIFVLGDQDLTRDFGVDPGIACQNILLGATSLGLGGCIIGSLRRDRLKELLGLPDHLELLLVIALGKPKEEIRIEPMAADGDVRYWRDEAGVHHVPKRSLAEILLTWTSGCPGPGSAP